MTTRRFLATTIGGLAALTLASCSSGSGSSGSNTIPADAGLVVYAGPGIKFDQTAYTATAGSVKIAYSNRDAQRHTFDVINANKTVIGAELKVNQSGDLSVGTYDLPAGTYTLQCLVPGHEAMKATLTVK